jgi:hypothetical protein
MSFYNLKRPEYKGKRFVVIDDSSAIKLNPANKHIPVIAASLFTIIGVPVIYILLKNESGISPDLFAAILFCIIVAWMWTQIINTIVEISIKENKIFFTDYLSNLKYLFIPDIVVIEENKSIITIRTKSDKIKINSGFSGINEFIDKLIKINPQIEKKGFNHVV